MNYLTNLAHLLLLSVVVEKTQFQYRDQRGIHGKPRLLTPISIPVIHTRALLPSAPSLPFALARDLPSSLYLRADKYSFAEDESCFSGAQVKGGSKAAGVASIVSYNGTCVFRMLETRTCTHARVRARSFTRSPHIDAGTDPHGSRSGGCFGPSTSAHCTSAAPRLTCNNHTDTHRAGES